jgi:hypothetical protein
VVKHRRETRQSLMMLASLVKPDTDLSRDTIGDLEQLANG